MPLFQSLMKRKINNSLGLGCYKPVERPEVTKPMPAELTGSSRSACRVPIHIPFPRQRAAETLPVIRPGVLYGAGILKQKTTNFNTNI